MRKNLSIQKLYSCILNTKKYNFHNIFQGRPGDKGTKGDGGSGNVDVFSKVKVTFASLHSLKNLPETPFLNIPNNNKKKKNSSSFKHKQLFSPLHQGLKRSVTTLRGGSLGYAEIVAVKVHFFTLDRKIV